MEERKRNVDGNREWDPDATRSPEAADYTRIKVESNSGILLCCKASMPSPPPPAPAVCVCVCVYVYVCVCVCVCMSVCV